MSRRYIPSKSHTAVKFSHKPIRWMINAQIGRRAVQISRNVQASAHKIIRASLK